jgi:dTDP-4-dehydrorhamnose reductase
MAHSKKIWITGAGGLLGAEVARRFQSGDRYEVIAADRAALDITDPRAVDDRLRSFRPDIVINCAAFTAVDLCESAEKAALGVNGDGAGFVAAGAAAVGARLIHISTDYVFEGDAASPYAVDHPPGRPERLSAYGRSKLLGEQRVAAAHPGALIVRTAWLYGAAGPCFPKTILAAARQRQELKVVDLADGLFRLAATDLTGICHVTNAGSCTWYEFAREILRVAGLATPVHPVTTAEFPRPARRPAYSVLDNRRYIEATGHPLRHWTEAIAAFLRE